MDIVTEKASWDKYQLLVLPDEVQLSDVMRERIKKHLAKGGRIIASGKSGLDAVKGFPENWPVSYKGELDFAPAYFKYADREDEAPFDQHYLAALVAPRLLSVVTAEEDTWADTEEQYLCAEAASVIYEKCGVKGLDESSRLLTTPCRSTAGQIALCMRRGTHCFSRDDWRFFADVIREKQNN